jgi:hypothetical protein
MTTLFEKLFNIYTGTIVSSLVTAILLSSAFVLGAIMSLGMAFLPLLHKQGRAVTASASRCCLPTSSASSGSGGSACAGPAAHKTSSRSPRSRRTCGASPSWRLGRPRCPPRTLRKRRVRQCSVSTPTLLPERTATKGL